LFLPPMLPILSDKPFDDERYIFEPFIDGHRLVLSMENGIVRLYTRHRHEVTSQYPELCRVPVDNGSDVVLDGQITCWNAESGFADKEALLSRFKLTRPICIREAALRLPVRYFAFDLLRYRGQDLRVLPLMERKQILHRILFANRHFASLFWVEDNGTALFESVRKNRLGGIVAKAKQSKYAEGGNRDWLKIIRYDYAVVQIGGYRKNQFGWQMRHRNEDVGLLENGVTSAHRNAFGGISKLIFKDEDRDFVYVEPVVQARIRYRGRTAEGQFRAPEFIEFAV